MAVAVSAGVIGDFALAVDAAGNDGNGPLASQSTAQGIGIVAFVGEKVAGTVQLRQQHRSCLHIRDIAGRQREGKRSSKHVGQGMKLAGLAAARGANILRFRPPLPPWAVRCALI